jgi:hypothetical protein
MGSRLSALIRLAGIALGSYKFIEVLSDFLRMGPAQERARGRSWAGVLPLSRAVPGPLFLNP